MSEQSEQVREKAPVKKPAQHGSHRITPPEAIREAVGMERDEPWSWFWHPDSGRFFLRRAGAHLEGIPADAISVGVAESVKNGRYLDYAIPPSAVRIAGMEKGDVWEFIAIDRNTMHLVRR